MPKETRFQRVRKRQQLENEHNMVLANYVMQKYGTIADDVLECYKWLKKNWPNDGKPYKRTKNMGNWLQEKISTYIDTEEATDKQQQLPDADQQQLPAADQQQQLPDADQQQLPAADQQQQLPDADQQQLPAADQQQQQLPAADQQQLPAEAVDREQHGDSEALLDELDARVGELLEMFANEEDEGIEIGAVINTPEYEHLYPEEYDSETYDFDLGINIELPFDPLDAEHY